MKRTFRIFLAVLLSVMQLTVVLSLRQVWAEPQGWSKNYGGTDTSEEPYALVQASDGGYAIAGYTATNYNRDFWLVKTDADGTMLFNKSYGGTSFDTAHALVQTTDGGYALAGDTYIDGFHQSWLVKTDENGTMQWNKTYARNQCEALALVQTDDGGFALAGWASAGGYDFWLVKTDASGTEEWNKAYKRTQEDIANALVQTSDGGYAIAGYSYSFGSSSRDFWLVKTDALGNTQWNKTYGGTWSETAYALVQTTDDGYAIAGQMDYHFEPKFWLVKTDTSGTMQWNKTYGWGYYGSEARALVQTSDGGFALAGYVYSFGSPHRSWLVKTDANGNTQWNRDHGEGGSECVNALVQTTDGGYAMVSRVTSGNLDVHLVKTRADGAIRDSSPDLVLIALIVTGIVAVFLITLVFLRKLQRKQTSVSK